MADTGERVLPHLVSGSHCEAPRWAVRRQWPAEFAQWSEPVQIPGSACLSRYLGIWSYLASAGNSPHYQWAMVPALRHGKGNGERERAGENEEEKKTKRKASSHL